MMDDAYPSEKLARLIVERLQGAGHTAYFAGGCVRDRVMNREPKDFDVATSARPEEVLKLFPHSQQVGVAFGVVLVRET
jgi:poly(A) polymerase